MTAVPLNVRFQLHAGRDRWLDEDAWRPERESIAELGPPRGAVVIHRAADEARISDDLAALAQNVCFAAVTRIAEDEHVALRYYDKPGYVRLDPEGWWVRLSGDHVPELVLERTPLLEGLLSCGRRILDAMTELGYEGAAEEIGRRAEEASRRLAGARREWPGAPPQSVR
jgi:hypothetical protein